MKIRVNADYEATDGSVPGSVWVEVEYDGAGPAPAGVVDIVGGIMQQMQLVPAQRYVAPAMAMAAPVRSLVRSCARTACGCPQDSHGSRNDRGIEMGAGNGACLVCEDGTKCRSYVASNGAEAVTS